MVGYYQNIRLVIWAGWGSAQIVALPRTLGLSVARISGRSRMSFSPIIEHCDEGSHR